MIFSSGETPDLSLTHTYTHISSLQQQQQQSHLSQVFGVGYVN